MLGSPSAQHFAKLMGRSRQRTDDDSEQGGQSLQNSIRREGSTLSQVASRDGSVRVYRNVSTVKSGLSSPHPENTFRSAAVSISRGEHSTFVQSPMVGESGMEGKVARLEWIMSDIQMQLRGMMQGQNARFEEFLKGKAGPENLEVTEQPLDEVYQEIQELPIEEQFKHIQKLRRETQVYFPVATEIWANNWDDFPVEEPLEYTHCRYTPVVTTDCREFTFDGYSLRVTEMGRKIRMLVCITLYNEGQETVDRSLLGVCENLEYFIGNNKDHKQKILDWREIVVCLVQDGIEKASPSVLAASTVHGFYSPEVLQKQACGEDVNVHLFEYTARYEKFAGHDQYPPVQIIFLTKENNRGKLDSHCWYFDAVAHALEPDYCVLIDAGTYPRPSALPELFKYFERDPGCGAVTGELTVERPFRNFLTAVQFCEWKTAHLLNKPIESLCGYLTVLPGAFSAFRWRAVEGDPLRAYFLGLYAQAELNAFESNMFLAEDRILCLEIVAKANCAYRLHYVKDSVAEADPQTTLVALIKQRRRWLNGTFFALVYSLIKWGRIWKYSKHSFGRKLAFTMEGIYLFILMVTGSWLGLGLYYTALDQVVKASFANDSYMAEIGRIVVLVYLFLILVQVIVNLHNRPEAVDKIHLGCALYFILFMMLFTGLTVRLFVVNDDIVDWTTKVGAAISMGGSLVVAIFHGAFFSMAMSGLQYWLMQPVYMNILQIHAFCNTHDISWGTKNLDKGGGGHGQDYKHTFRKGYLTSGQQKKESKAFWDAQLKEAERKMNPQAMAEFNKKKEQKFKAFATYLLIAWLTTNVVLARVIESLAGLTWTVCTETDENVYIKEVKTLFEGNDDNYLKVARIVEASDELIQGGEEAYPFGGIPDWPTDDMFLMWGVAQSRARQNENITVALVTNEVTKEVQRMLPSWEEWAGYISGQNTSHIAQDILDLNLPPSKNETTAVEVECKIVEGRTFYLRWLFIALAVVAIVQVLSSLIYILEYRLMKLRWAIQERRERKRQKQTGINDAEAPTPDVGLLSKTGLNKIKVNAEGEERVDGASSDLEDTIPTPAPRPAEEVRKVGVSKESGVSLHGFMLTPPHHVMTQSPTYEGDKPVRPFQGTGAPSPLFPPGARPRGAGLMVAQRPPTPQGSAPGTPSPKPPKPQPQPQQQPQPQPQPQQQPQQQPEPPETENPQESGTSKSAPATPSAT